MDWDDVRYFLLLARAGSLSAAARTLAVEHTTVSRRVSALEAALRVRLFDRLARGWMLTPEGRELLAPAEAIEAQTLSFARRALGTSDLAGPVRVSAPPLLVTHFVVPHLRRLARVHPHIDLALSADRRSADLVRGETEIALRVGPFEAAPDLVVRPLGKIGYGLYGSADQIARPPDQQTFVGFDQSMNSAAQKQWLDNHAGVRRVVFRSNDLFALYRAACAGLGIALLPHLLVGDDDGLHSVPASAGAAFERDFSLLLHADVRRSKRVKAVADFLVDLARTSQDWLRGPPGAPSGKRRRRASAVA